MDKVSNKCSRRHFDNMKFTKEQREALEYAIRIIEEKRYSLSDIPSQQKQREDLLVSRNIILDMIDESMK